MKSLPNALPVSIYTSLRNSLFTAFFCLFAATAYPAAIWYVAPKGDDANPGTIEAPFATLQKGHDKASAGDTVYLRGGTYTFNGSGATSLIGVSIKKSGKSATERINFWAYEDEVPILDFSGLKLGSGIGAGIRVQGQWLHFKGIEICNVPAPTGANNGIWCNPCTNNIFERMHFHHNQGPGLSIAYGNGGLLILNCDSHDNYDVAKDGEDGDGIGIHYQQTKGDTIVIRGCRAWYNADDGYDLFNQKYPVIIENCWAYGNGYFSNGKATRGNGAGFKMGNSFAKGVRHTIRNCVAWKNRNQGFYANHSPAGTNWYNNTSYNNGAQFDMYSDSVLSGSNVHVLRNNVAFPKVIKNPGASDMKFNTWNLNITPAADDFAGVSDSGWTGPRKPDGSLPDIPFMKLRSGSKLIDKGTDVGLPFTGEAPDLGAYEFGMTTAALQQPFSPRPVAGATLQQGLRIPTPQLFDLAGRGVSISAAAAAGVRLFICRSGSGAARLLLYTPSRHPSEPGAQF
ncbi:MAG: right-handed parallel beta-helix repeat-containing protein [Chitinispirillaceae bacterium]|nr:right-handed parallel beta-helix repeat-containing protein [Chitinispirillaceae bacterium]